MLRYLLPLALVATPLAAQPLGPSAAFRSELRTRLLAEQAITVAEAYLNGEEPEANDTETYDNGVKVVPSYLLDSVIVYKDNVQADLIDTGYWTAEEVAAGQADGA